MPLRLDARKPGFEARFRAFLSLKRDAEHTVADTVREVVRDVRARGDAALLEYTARFDRFGADAHDLYMDEYAIAAAAEGCDPKVVAALEVAAERIRDYHRRQIPQGHRYEDAHGVILGWRWTPVASAGVYVPGGRAAYPSSVLMNAIPAQVAGVTRLVMAVPTPDGVLNPAVFAAARIAGIAHAIRAGGAQAVAALAHGTERLLPVDVVVGPGNAYVAEAKRQVYGTVGIDMIAGPSEILVVADNRTPPEWIAADLLSQAEHDPAAQSILITDDAAFANAVTDAVERTLAALPRVEISRESWDRFGAVIVVPSLTDAVPLVDAIAPEHLELALEDPEAFAARVRHAGAIFLGRHTPEAIGDYLAGPSHVLPTSGTARFSSGLSVYDFLKRTSLIGCSANAFSAIAESAAVLADAEGLPAHALSLRIRR